MSFWSKVREWIADEDEPSAIVQTVRQSYALADELDELQAKLDRIRALVEKHNGPQSNTGAHALAAAVLSILGE